MIGGLTHLIRGAAIRAILGGQEALTRALLEQRPYRPCRRGRHPPGQQHPVTLNPARLAYFTGWSKTLQPRCDPDVVAHWTTLEGAAYEQVDHE